jgi:hypothetical protein
MDECRTEIVCQGTFCVNEKCNLITQVWQKVALLRRESVRPVGLESAGALTRKYWNYSGSRELAGFVRLKWWDLPGITGFPPAGIGVAGGFGPRGA